MCGSAISQILLPVAVVRGSFAGVLGQLAGDGGDPDGSESHSLDVVQLTTSVSSCQ